MWKKYCLKRKEKRRREQERIWKITKIQAWIRGTLMRKHLRRKLKERLSSNETYFNNLRSYVIIESTIIIQRAWRRVVENIRKFRKVQKYLQRRKRKVIIAKWNKYTKKMKKQRMKNSLYDLHNQQNQDYHRKNLGDTIAAGKSIK